LVNVSLLYAEVIRDVGANAPENPQRLTLAQMFARTTVHEVAHQFGLVNKDDGPGVQFGHRQEPSVMVALPYPLPANQFFFHPKDIRRLRWTRQSP
jgi:hypothetical protein